MVVIILTLKIPPVSHQFINLFDRNNSFYLVVFVYILYYRFFSITLYHIHLKAKTFIKVDFGSQ